MKPWYAINAQRLLQDRQQGMKPNAPVAVVLTGDTVPAPALYVKDDMPVERLDWRMLVNLDVWLYASPAVPLDRWMRVGRAIAAARPKRLTLRFLVDGHLHDVDFGASMHMDAIADVPAIHEFTWSPLDLSLTPIGARLRAAMARELPMWSTL